MKFLFISEDLVGGHVALRLKEEGHDVKLYIDEEERRGNFSNLVPTVSSWKDQLSWVGKSGTIVFDYVGAGTEQDRLRQDGFAVFGGGFKGELLEENRQKTHDLFNSLNFSTVPILDFKSIDDALQHVTKHPMRYVVKKNGTSSNSVSYVGMLDNGADVIDVLKNYKEYNPENTKSISLQKWIGGIEIAVARFFNGTEWITPIELNIEHNPLMPGDIGLSTSEMGTIGWYTHNEENPIFKNTLAKLAPHLQSINYRGAIDINCIVNEDGIFPLEVTARFGSPIVHLQSEMFETPWGEIIYACAHGEKINVSCKTGYGIVLFITAPPFPYIKKLPELNPKGQRIYFDTPYDVVKDHIHLEDVSYDTINSTYYISDTRGYILYVTAEGPTMSDGQALAYKRVSEIHFPKMMYRNDIGTKFIEKDESLLRQWGYIE
ncbi:MAG: phosphoribosylamine--glycine ligase [Candidatus Azotimanducaceae bacterium]|jgi:phosphoribosylamine--glycine ligase